MRDEHREYNVRAEAVKSLCRIMRDGKYPNLELGAAMGKAEFPHADRSLYAALVYGVCERALTLDYVIANLTGRDVGTLDGETLSALRVGLYQIYYMDKIPPHAAVNETVAASPAPSRRTPTFPRRRSRGNPSRSPAKFVSTRTTISYVRWFDGPFPQTDRK